MRNRFCFRNFIIVDGFWSKPRVTRNAARTTRSLPG